MRFKHLLLLLFISFSCYSQSIAQETTVVDSAFLFTPDSVEFFQSVSKKDPNRAALLSAVLPGLGQAYNGDYWKIPLIYSGFIVMGHVIYKNNLWYNEYRTQYIAMVDNDETTINNFIANGANFTEDNTLRRRDAFRRDRDYMMIWAGVLYLLNVAEAHIAAHLKEFELNDALSMKFQPSIQSTPLFSQAVGVSLTLNFK